MNSKEFMTSKSQKFQTLNNAAGHSYFIYPIASAQDMLPYLLHKNTMWQTYFEVLVKLFTHFDYTKKVHYKLPIFLVHCVLNNIDYTQYIFILCPYEY